MNVQSQVFSRRPAIPIVSRTRDLETQTIQLPRLITIVTEMQLSLLSAEEIGVECLCTLAGDCPVLLMNRMVCCAACNIHINRIFH